jgi:transcription initiation factor TFIIE subunit beta
MDSSLLREHEAFKKRAAANVSLGLSDIKSKRPESQADTKPPKAKKPKLESAPKEMNYKAMSGSSDNKFAILAKIVKHLKIRHQKGDSDPLTFEEILDETSQEGISAKNKHWLNTEALKNNPKIETMHGETYRFKPEFNMREKNGLRKCSTGTVVKD